jgi:hypothetical protein
MAFPVVLFVWGYTPYGSKINLSEEANFSR